MVDKMEPPKPQAPRPDEPEVVDLEAEDEMPLGTLETKAEFDEIVIWGHESVADTSSDPYVRGVEEWMKVAEKVRVAWERRFYSDTDMSRYILTMKRGSELLGEIGQASSSSSVALFVLGILGILRLRNYILADEANPRSSLQTPSGTQSLLGCSGERCID